MLSPTHVTGRSPADAGGAPASSPDPAAWVDDHGDVLYRYALRRLSHPADAEDAVQDALLAGLRGWDRFDGRSTVRTWLVGILRHKVLDALQARVARREATATSPRATADAATEHAMKTETACIRPAPSEMAELRVVLRMAIDQLDSPMREAILLRVVDGHSTSAVCEALGISREQCWTLVHRGKARLQQALERAERQDRSSGYAVGMTKRPSSGSGSGSSMGLGSGPRRREA
jgi:RNA polymerase sigma-70 factor (ECF subfamily)